MKSEWKYRSSDRTISATLVIEQETFFVPQLTAPIMMASASYPIVDGQPTEVIVHTELWLVL